MSVTTRRKKSKSSSNLTEKEGKETFCGKCGEYCDGKSVECGICLVWSHCECVGININNLPLLENEQIHWFCHECNSAAATLFEHIFEVKDAHCSLAAKVKSSTDKLSSEIEELKASIATLKTNHTSEIIQQKAELEAVKSDSIRISREYVDSKLSKQKEEIKEEVSSDVDNKIDTKLESDDVKRTFAQAASSNIKLDDVKAELTRSLTEVINNKTSQVPETISKEVKEEAQERDRIKRRECNLIIHHLPESQDYSDESQVDSIIKDVLFLNDVQITNTTRLGEKKDNWNRLLRITLADLSMKKRILARATELRNLPPEDFYSKVYIRPDLTPKQLEASKNLYLQLKEVRENNPTKVFKIVKGAIKEIKQQ